MEFRRIRDGSSIIDSSEVLIGSTPIGFLPRNVILSPYEKEGLNALARDIWKAIRPKDCSAKGMLVRFDFVPRISSGDIYGDAILEVNVLAPEDFAAWSQAKKAFPEVPNFDVLSVFFRKFYRDYETKKVIFVSGKSPMKNSWKKEYIKALRKAGFTITVMSEKAVMKAKHLKDIVYVWGDLESKHFSKKFSKWCLRQKPGVIFNPPLPESQRPFGKKQLLGLQKDAYLERFVGGKEVTFSLTKKTFKRARKLRKKLVLKPDGGGSGIDVVIGKVNLAKKWKKKLKKALASKKKFTLWEFRELPKICIDGEFFAIDINLTGWVNSFGEFEPIAYIIRIMPWKKYRKNPVINVACGGAYSIHIEA